MLLKLRSLARMRVATAASRLLRIDLQKRPLTVAATASKRLFQPTNIYLNSIRGSMASWQPGDQIVFATTAGPEANSGGRARVIRRTSPATSGRIDGLVNKAKTAKPGSTTWTSSHWQPGMPVNTVDTSDHRPALPVKPVTSTKPKAKKREAKSKASESSSQSSLESFWPPTKKTHKSATPKKISFTSAQATMGDRSEPSTANATAGAYDSSIEVVAEKHSPLSSALRHFALAQNHLKEAVAKRNAEEKTAFSPSTSSRTLFPPTSPPSILPRALTSPPSRPKLGSSRSHGEARSFSTSAVNTVQSSIDWDDPVITADLADLSSSSDLPEGPYKLKPQLKAVLPPAKSDKGKGKEMSRQPFQAVNPTTAISKSNTAAPKKGTAKEKKVLAAEGKRLRQEQKDEKKAAKAKEAAGWKEKYPTFSYDNGTYITPKVWYFRGPNANFMSCDTRSGPGAAKTMEEVAASLQGPLGFDMEWNVTGWNEDHTKKNAQGKTGLIQLGDSKNIILYQVAGAKIIPKCLLDIIEDREVIKLGVNIKNDGGKLQRDFGSKTSPIKPSGFLELSDMAKFIDPIRYAGVSHLIALQRLVIHWMDMYLDKGDERTSNWDKELRPMQRKYAANDVFVAVKLYNRLAGHAVDPSNPNPDFSQCIHDLHYRRDKNGIWENLGWAPHAFALRVSAPGGGVQDGQKPPRPAPTKVGPRQMEAWEHWHMSGKERDDIATTMGIQAASVAGYIVKALTIDAGLPYDLDRLKALPQGILIRKEQAIELNNLLTRPAATADVNEEGQEEEDDEEEEEEEYCVGRERSSAEQCWRMQSR